MALFGRRRWSPPKPECTFLVLCDAARLPPFAEVADRDGGRGRLRALVAPAGGEAMRFGEAYSLLTPMRGAWRATVRVADLAMRPAPDIWPFVGLDEGAGGRLATANADVVVELGPGEGPLADDILFGTRLADRIAELSGGVVLDHGAVRAWPPGGWRIPEPVDDFDVREHVVVHAVPDDDGSWVHTHGLVKFGRPELEVLAVPHDLVDAAAAWLNALGQYVTADGASIEPGHTLGDPHRPVRAQAGGRDREHWGDAVVIELADDGTRHGAEHGLRDWLAAQ